MDVGGSAGGALQYSIIPLLKCEGTIIEMKCEMDVKLFSFDILPS